jgi:hypothetical protein
MQETRQNSLDVELLIWELSRGKISESFFGFFF